MIDIAIIGGGAAGLAAAIASCTGNNKVSIIEGNDAPGKKILITGGGRCNFTNLNLSYKDYYDGDKTFISSVLDDFSPIDAVNFMYESGVLPIIRNGYAYPASEEAATVRDALVNKCQKLGISIHNNSRVLSISKDSEGFNIQTDNYLYKASKVIITCGGCATPGTGSKGDGYNFAKSFGHHVTNQYPALTGICFKDPILKAQGTRVNGALKLIVDDKEYIEQGEIQINDYGISGIPVMSLSRIVSKNLNRKLSLIIDFLPGISEEELSAAINCCGLKGMLPKKLAAAFSGNENKIKAYSVCPTGVKDFDTAHVTSGGVDTSEIDPSTMESRICQGLYFAGEIIDIDGRCGGYNLHFAWASGNIAGQSAANGKYIKKIISEENKRLFEKCEIGNRRS